MENIIIKINDKTCLLKDLAAVMGVQGVIEAMKIFHPDGRTQTWEITEGKLTYKLAG